MKYSNLSHRGLMKMACAQNDLIINMLTAQRFYESTKQSENANNAWDRAVADFTKAQREIFTEDKTIKVKE